MSIVFAGSPTIVDSNAGTGSSGKLALTFKVNGFVPFVYNPADDKKPMDGTVTIKSRSTLRAVKGFLAIPILPDDGYFVRVHVYKLDAPSTYTQVATGFFFGADGPNNLQDFTLSGTPSDLTFNANQLCVASIVFIGPDGSYTQAPQDLTVTCHFDVG